MDVVHPRCAGIDISKTDAKVCARIVPPGGGKPSSKVTTWPAMTGDIIKLGAELASQQIGYVVMEATGDYWKPFYYLLVQAGLEVALVNPQHVKNMPGRKTDVSDAAWLADLGAHGLVKASFVPPEPIALLRDLVRTRTTLVRLRGQEAQRIDKVLQDAGIRLSSVATNIMGVSGRAMLNALIAGSHDPAALADLATHRLRSKIPLLEQALQGRFDPAHHGVLIQVHLNLIDSFDDQIDVLDARIGQVLEEFDWAVDLLQTIPGISEATAIKVIAEIGVDMTVFPTPGKLTSWAGLAPGSNESAGKVKSAKCRPGDKWLKGALGIAGLAASKKDGSYLQARHRRIRARQGKAKALVATSRGLLVAVWHVLATGRAYVDPGAGFFTTLHPQRAVRHAVARLESLGYQVTLTTTKQPVAGLFS